MDTPLILGHDGGVMLRRELLAAGYDDRSIRRLLRAGTWTRIRVGAYCDTQDWIALTPEAQHRVLSRAVLKTHPGAVLSHVSAVIEHGGKVYGVPLDHVHLSRPGKSGRREAGIVHHRGTLPDEDVMEHDGILVTTPARASIELTTQATVEQALVSLNWFLGSGVVTFEELGRVATAARHWPNSLRTDLAVRLADGRCRWPGEARFAHLAWIRRLPIPEPQVEIRDERGHLVAIVDFAWPAHGVFLEFDGLMKYSRLRNPTVTLDQYLMQEKQREELVTQLTGWMCVRIGWADLGRPDLLARRINSILAGRTSRAG